ncbi:MAG: HAD-IC family P-type ATPase [Polaromonas sp.]|uniref:HAD-IC family P-type ATPase n=1 Tax=Polaromonas sp. TaxID=1869339 RepID=UPI0027327E2C|nr:HAD-IC family P-type ATPase [Polaromonas sp.]MDP2817652.1 HAD-IC family P-type ATPase [Polaromonas sp.]
MSPTEDVGLTQPEVNERRQQGQVNRVEKFTTRTVSGILRNNVLTAFNAILTASVGALLAVGAHSDAVFVSIVTLANMLVGIASEFRAKWALDRLALLQRHVVTVRRDGHDQEIPSDEVVKDDLVRLTPGDQVVADGELARSASVVMDESLLTGEATAVGKRAGDAVLSGSYCVSGTGYYAARRVGAASSVNTLTAQARTYKLQLTPTQKSINTLVKALTAILILFVVLLLMAAYIKHVPLNETILSLVTVIKALVPEGLVLISTLAFAMGALRAARKQVLVQKLGAVESLAHLTVLCMDKTGTLGTNRLQFETLLPFALGHDELARYLGLFLGAVTEKNQTTEAIASAFPSLSSTVIDELPFSTEHKTSAVRVGINGEEMSLWLGAPEAIAENRLTVAQSAQLTDLRQRGLRVLLFARSAQVLSQQNDLLSLGFVILRDELRQDVDSAIRFYEARGVTLKVLSGDNPDTVSAVARQAGITLRGSAISGPELAVLAPEAFAKAVHENQFFGRLLPQQKQQIVKCLQESGDFVGMVGDGVNDVLALKQADIGVAMNSGAAAARDVSDIVLLRDSFAHLPALSQEGDRIIHSIKRVMQLFLTKNVYSLFFVGFVGFVGLSFPLSPRDITWIDVLTIGIPATVLTLLAPAVGKQSTENFLRGPLKFALLAGLCTALFSLFVYANFFLFQDRTEQYGSTAVRRPCL